MMQPRAIYCLYSSADGIPRYVGPTEESADKAFKRHVTAALDMEIGRLYDWIRAVWRAKREIGYHVLQTNVVPTELDFYQRYWINQFAGLLNVDSQDAPPGRNTGVESDVILAIKAKLVVQDT
jgi:hypothetical protein